MTDQEFTTRLVLGTAQLGLPYGLNNTSGEAVAPAETARILHHARAAGLTLLDTAAAYGQAEKVLGEWAAAHPAPTPAQAFRVVTKLRGGTTQAEVAAQLAESCGRLGGGPLYGLLFHDFETARQQPPEVWQWLAEQRAAGAVQRLGFSLYHPAQLDWLLDHSELAFDLLQVPYNVFDQRFGHYLLPLVRRGVEVHLRSCFLQGVLLRPPDALPPHFAPLRPKLHRLHALIAAHGVPLAAALLLFAAQAVQPPTHPLTDARAPVRVVIGIDSLANLRENLAAGRHFAAAQALGASLLAFAEADEQFLLPYTWPQ